LEGFSLNSHARQQIVPSSFLRLYIDAIAQTSSFWFERLGSAGKIPLRCTAMAFFNLMNGIPSS
jgi:hypothetical protein